MTSKRTHFEAIPEKTQNNWEVPDEMAEYAKKYFEKYVSDKELKDTHLIVQYQQRLWMATFLNC